MLSEMTFFSFVCIDIQEWIIRTCSLNTSVGNLFREIVDGHLEY